MKKLKIIFGLSAATSGAALVTSVFSSWHWAISASLFVVFTALMITAEYLFYNEEKTFDVWAEGSGQTLKDNLKQIIENDKNVVL